jgi:endonuclease YncB( thermonuclease family)
MSRAIDQARPHLDKTRRALGRPARIFLLAGLLAWTAFSAAAGVRDAVPQKPHEAVQENLYEAVPQNLYQAVRQNDGAGSAVVEPIFLLARGPSRSPSQAVEAGPAFEARMLRVDDGDSLVVRGADGTTSRIRLAGIDAPEKSQPFANVAREKLPTLLGKRTLSIAAIKIDPWGRLVARVDAQDEDIALAMLDAGLAWHYARYDSDLPVALRERYAKAAALARQQRIGLWRTAKPEPPWEFRRRSR